jgi:hypothetical protein
MLVALPVCVRNKYSANDHLLSGK